MTIQDLLCAVLFGVVEGVTEWLPVSSTGHLLLLGGRIESGWAADFFALFSVAVQAGALGAVGVRYFGRLLPFSKRGRALWGRILLAVLPAAIVGVLWEDAAKARFYNPTCIGVMLVALGVVFLLEKRITARHLSTECTAETLPLGAVIVIGLAQTMAAVFPGTSRSGATMLGGMLCGIARTAAAEFTFLMGVPVMGGATLLAVSDFARLPTPAEWGILAVGMGVAFAVSLVVMDGLLRFLRRHGLAAFGWYRILLGTLVLVDNHF